MVFTIRSFRIPVRYMEKAIHTKNERHFDKIASKFDNKIMTLPRVEQNSDHTIVLTSFVKTIGDK